MWCVGCSKKSVDDVRWLLVPAIGGGAGTLFFVVVWCGVRGGACVVFFGVRFFVFLGVVFGFSKSLKRLAGRGERKKQHTRQKPHE